VDSLLFILGEPRTTYNLAIWAAFVTANPFVLGGSNFRNKFWHMLQLFIIALGSISRLETMLREWAAADRCCLAPRMVIPAIDKIEWRFKLDDLPPEASVLAANAIHNMRVPLDQMLMVYFRSLVGDPKARPRDISFPARNDREGFFKAVSLLKKRGLPTLVTDFLKTEEAFIGGVGEVISVLHALDIDSKHHGLLTVEVCSAKMLVGEIRAKGGILFRIGQLDGQHMLNARPGVLGKQDLIQDRLEARPIYREVSGAGRFEINIADTTQSVLLTSPDFDANGAVKYEIEMLVSLSHESLKGRETIEFLKQAHDHVTNTLSSFVEFAQR
jgi:hypothetical protein